MLLVITMRTDWEKQVPLIPPVFRSRTRFSVNVTSSTNLQVSATRKRINRWFVEDRTEDRSAACAWWSCISLLPSWDLFMLCFLQLWNLFIYFCHFQLNFGDLQIPPYLMFSHLFFNWNIFVDFDEAQSMCIIFFFNGYAFHSHLSQCRINEFWCVWWRGNKLFRILISFICLLGKIKKVFPFWFVVDRVGFYHLA